VIGGRRTILSRQFTRPFHGGTIEVVGRIAQPLSALIERGELEGPRLQRTLRDILTPLRSCEALVLACTHYPAVAPQIQKFLPHVRLLDPAVSTAKFVRDSWKMKARRGGHSVFITSGSADAMIRAARVVFGVRIARVIKMPRCAPAARR
jgi:glutamate racemase